MIRLYCPTCSADLGRDEGQPTVYCPVCEQNYKVTWAGVVLDSED